MKVYVENIEDVKEWLEWAHQVHKTIQYPRPPKADISLLGLAMPSHIWSNDADGQYTSDDIDNMWFIYENWFNGLSRREKLVVLLRSAKARWKTISWLLYENYHIFEGNSSATIRNDYAKALLKVYNNAR